MRFIAIADDGGSLGLLRVGLYEEAGGDPHLMIFWTLVSVG
jgi:hypothetical protein